MQYIRNFSLLVFSAGLVFGAEAPLASVLKRMDQSAAGFRGLSAGITRLTHTAIINDNTLESGKMLLQQDGGKRPRILIEFTKPDSKTVAFHNKDVQIFYPKMNTVEIWDLGKQSKLVDQFLLLGFGTSGSELVKSYDVKLLGEEAVEGRKATRLELVPKSAEVRREIIKVELWLSESGAYPIRQKVHQPSGNYMLITYSDVLLNPNLPEDSVKLKLPNGVKKVRPQK